MLEKDATWVAIGFVLFILLLIYFKIPKTVGKLLDDRAKMINDELEEATKLREEAQAILSDFQKKQKYAEKLAKDLINNAKKAAKNYEKEAKEKFDESILRRKKLIDEKLKNAEIEAVNEIKNNLSDIVLSAVEKSLSNGNIKDKAAIDILNEGIDQIKK
tara:strand:+ start:16263 stop:16742 length:480 start_codon:yes stop_codon:yes gene_type:complete